MSLVLSTASTADAARIAEIHMAAFGQNGMLLAQFPTPAVRKGLQVAIEQKALADILDPKISVLVVRDVRIDKASIEGHSQDNKHTIAFAKWIHPVEPDEDYTEPAWVWPDGTRLDVLDAWTQQVENAERKVLGDSPCYRKFESHFCPLKKYLKRRFYPSHASLLTFPGVIIKLALTSFQVSVLWVRTLPIKNVARQPK